MTNDRRLVVKGRSETLQGLLEQARYHQKLAEQHATELAENNWSAQDTSELVAELEALDSDKSRQLDERGRAKEMTRNESAAISEAKALINKVRNVARMVVRKNPNSGVVEDDFHAGGPLGRAVGRISEYLGKLRVTAGKLDAAFAPYFKQQILSKLIDEARAKLDQASASQEVDFAALPADTAAVYEHKGRLLELIEDLNGIARNAFLDDPLTRAKFNKDLLNRARRPRKRGEEPAPGPTPPPSPS